MEKPKVKVKTPPTKRKSRAAKLRFVYGHLIGSSLYFSKRNSFLANRMFPIYSKEQIALALQKKKECNARAQRIVEEFLDPVPIEKVDFFLSSVSHHLFRFIYKIFQIFTIIFYISQIFFSFFTS